MVYVVELITNYKVVVDVTDTCGCFRKASNITESRKVVGIFKNHENAVKCRKLEESNLHNDTPSENSFVVIREIESDF